MAIFNSYFDITRGYHHGPCLVSWLWMVWFLPSGLHDASSCGTVDPGGSCQVDCLLPYKGTGYKTTSDPNKTMGKMVEKNMEHGISTMENLDLRKLIQLIFRCYHHLDPFSNLGNRFHEMQRMWEFSNPWRHHAQLPWFLVPGIAAWDQLGSGTTGTASIATCPLDNINTTGGRRQELVVSWWFHHIFGWASWKRPLCNLG